MNLKKARKRKQEWTSSSKCPICKNKFKSSKCIHSIKDVYLKLDEDLIKEVIKKEIKKSAV